MSPVGSVDQCPSLLQGFQGEFLWQGTSDLSGILAVPSAVAIARALGAPAAAYRRQLLTQAAELLLAAWGTKLVVGGDAPEATMAAVEMPGGWGVVSHQAEPKPSHPLAQLSRPRSVSCACLL